jgi:tripartite-type tricarboxylate transporter receptor subunit TctC
MVVNYPAGGALDLAVRSISEQMSKNLGQVIVVENKGGASGIIGARDVARQKPDGYTLLATIDSLVTVNPYIYTNTDFNPQDHLEPLGILGTFNQILMVNKATGISSLGAFIKKASQKEPNYASAGAGTPGHIAMESLKLASGMHALHIPFKGNGPALNALVADQVDAGFLAASGSTLQHIQAGTLVPLAVSSKERNPLLPNVPTIAESGIKGLENFDLQFAFLLMTPKGMDPSIAARISEALQTSMKTPEVKERLEQLNVQPSEGTAAQAQQWLKNYGGTMLRVIKSANIKVQ